jgi:DNA polymerase-1
VLDNAAQIKGAMGEKIKAGKEAAIMSKKLATIILNVPVVFNAEEYKLSDFNKEALNEIFAELEFKTMGKRILGDSFNITSNSSTLKAPAKVNKSNQTDLFATETDAPGAPLMPAILPEPEIEEGLIADKNINNTPHQYILVDTDEALQELITTLSGAAEICFDTETTGLDANQADIVGASFSIKSGTAWYVPFSANRQEAITKLMLFNRIFENENIRWIGQNIKYDMLILKRHGFALKGNLFDTMLAHYLIEPEGRRSMDLLSAKYLGYQPVSIEELIGKKGKNQITMRDVEAEKIKDYAAEDADITFQLKEIFEPIVNQKQVDKVFYEMENPLIKVLTDMEYEGIKIDVDFLNDYAAQLAIEAKESEESVYAQAGIRFNLASPKQLGEILFDHLKLDPKAKKTKTGQYATGEDILVKMQGTHKIVDDILAFRELTKLKSTYVDALPNLVNPSTGRVHTSYNQAVAVTGRLSSNNPNLQNIPIRTARGREIRKAFIAGGDDFLILSADYSQIELRIVAAISGDENMCEAFRQGKDIHTATAAKVYGIDENEVTKEMRYKAKSVNFGIIYGQGAFGLSQNLGISRTEAKQLIDNYFNEYATVKTYMDNQVNFAKQNGYVQTILGRKRWLKDIHSANAVVRGYAERNAINMPIQGSAADMIKLAMIAIQKEIKGLNLKSKMLLQVHDELVFDAHKTELEQLKEIIIRCMRNAMPLPHGVPADAEVGVGANWLEAH